MRVGNEDVGERVGNGGRCESGRWEGGRDCTGALNFTIIPFSNPGGLALCPSKMQQWRTRSSMLATHCVNRLSTSVLLIRREAERCSHTFTQPMTHTSITTMTHSSTQHIKVLPTPMPVHSTQHHMPTQVGIPLVKLSPVSLGSLLQLSMPIQLCTNRLVLHTRKGTAISIHAPGDPLLPLPLRAKPNGCSNRRSRVARATPNLSILVMEVVAMPSMVAVVRAAVRLSTAMGPRDIAIVLRVWDMVLEEVVVVVEVVEGVGR